VAAAEDADDEVYALTAYILAFNKIIGENDVMNAETLPKVKMTQP
jgi:cytochrome c